MRNKLMVFEQVEPPPRERNRYRIVETFRCIDGYRTRVTHTSFSNFEDAQRFVFEHKENESE